MCEPGKPPPDETPNSSERYGVGAGPAAMRVAISWSTERYVFHPKVQPPEQSLRGNVPSFASGDPVNSTAGPRVCGAPGPSGGRPMPSSRVSFDCHGNSGSRMYGSVKL